MHTRQEKSSKPGQMKQSTKRTLKGGAKVQHCGKDKILNRVSSSLSDVMLQSTVISDRHIYIDDFNFSKKILADTEQSADFKL